MLDISLLLHTAPAQSKCGAFRSARRTDITRDSFCRNFSGLYFRCAQHTRMYFRMFQQQYPGWRDHAFTVSGVVRGLLKPVKLRG